jgi:hypothetical protein
MAASRGGEFWESRAAEATPEARPAAAIVGTAPILCGVLELSPLLQFVDVPCIDGEFVTVKTAVSHPALDAPLAYLGPWELGPLLRGLPSAMTPTEMVRSWSDRVPLQYGRAIADWLLGRRILVPASSSPGAAGIVPLPD